MTLKNMISKLCAVFLALMLALEGGGISCFQYEIASASDGENVEYSVDYGDALWKDDSTKTSFTLPYATVKCGNDGVFILSITVKNGTFDSSDATLKDLSNKSATWIFSVAKSASEIQEKIRNISFSPTTAGASMNIQITIDGNPTTGFDDLAGKTLRQSETNGHYYLYIPKVTNWRDAYNESKKYVLGGKKGYLVNTTTDKETEEILDLAQNVSVWVGGTALRLRQMVPDTLDYRYVPINDAQRIGDSLGDDDLGIPQEIQEINKEIAEEEAGGAPAARPSKRDDIIKLMFWAGGPESLKKEHMPLTEITWAHNEPNIYPQAGVSSFLQQCETCAMYIIPNESEPDYFGFNDIVENNVRDESDRLCAKGFVVEFGGYEEAGFQDPGGYDKSKSSVANDVEVTPFETEATINTVRYGTVEKAINGSKSGDTIVIVQSKTAITAADNQILKDNVTLKDGTKSYTAQGNSQIDIASNKTITVNDGRINTSGGSIQLKAKGTDGQSHTIITPSCNSSIILDSNNEVSDFIGENDGIVNIDSVEFTYVNPGADESATVSIPNAMLNNEHVVKAEIPSNLTKDVSVSDTNIIEVKGGGSASQKVSIIQENNGFKVVSPQNATISAFEHTNIKSTNSNLNIVGPNNQNDRTKVTVSNNNSSFVADGHTYSNLSANDEIPLGLFNITVECGDNVSFSPNKTNAYYNDSLEYIFTPSQGYELNTDDVTLTVDGVDSKSDANIVKEGNNIKVSFTLKGNTIVALGANIQECTLNFEKIGDGLIAITKVSDGSPVDITNGRATVSGADTYKIVFKPGSVTSQSQARNEAKTFSILTGLTLNGTDVFAGVGNINWDDKSYSWELQPTQSTEIIKATFTKSHIVTITASGTKVLDSNLSAFPKDPNSTEQSITALIPDQTKNQAVTFKMQTSSEIGDINGYPLITLNGQRVRKNSFLYSTPPGQNDPGSGDQAKRSFVIPIIDQPTTLDVDIIYNQALVNIEVNGGSLDEDLTDEAWYTDTANPNKYSTVTKKGDNLQFVILPNSEEMAVKSATINGKEIDRGLFELQDDHRYKCTIESINDDSDINITLASGHSVTFKDDSGNILENGVVQIADGLTIPDSILESMMNKLIGKAGWQFRGWTSEDGIEFDSTSPVLNDVTLVATYSQVHNVVDPSTDSDNPGNINGDSSGVNAKQPQKINGEGSSSLLSTGDSIYCLGIIFGILTLFAGAILTIGYVRRKL